jgi:hypothetical protein
LYFRLARYYDEVYHTGTADAGKNISPGYRRHLHPLSPIVIVGISKFHLSGVDQDHDNRLLMILPGYSAGSVTMHALLLQGGLQLSVGQVQRMSGWVFMRKGGLAMYRRQLPVLKGSIRIPLPRKGKLAGGYNNVAGRHAVLRKRRAAFPGRHFSIRNVRHRRAPREH